ncbi:MAG: hypothetical protein Q9166_003382 [cf. Caloplaca sp. 2 TL-2023]
MVSRSYSSSTRPLEARTPTVAGRCKPMRVEKPKKARINKVKQGAPPKLSASQKRKLVRLYVFTSLSWKDISTLVFHFGQKDVKKRALQYILQGLLSAQYDQMRPKDTTTRRKRVSQIQRCRILTSAYKQQQKTQHVLSRSANASLPQSIETVIDYSDKTGLDPAAGITDLRKAAEGDESYLSDFDRFINFDAIQSSHENVTDHDVSLSSSADTVADASLCSQRHLTWDMGLPPAQQLNDCFVSYTSGLDSFNESSQMLDSSVLRIPNQTNPLQTDNPPLTDNRLGPFGGGHQYAFLSGVGFDTSNAIRSPEPGTDPAFTEVNTGEPVPSTSKTQNLDVDASRNTASSTIVSQNLRTSDLSAFIDRLSKCSSGEKEFIKDALKRFSAATSSSLSSSIRSRLSGRSRRTAESLGSHMPTSLISVENTRDQPELPRNLVYVDLNTGIFWNHMAYEMKNWYSFASAYCEGHCFNNVTQVEWERWSNPLFTSQFTQGSLMQEIWSESGLPCWSDRFGNTSLHIAATSGAPYLRLRALIDEGVSVNALNSAKQTFMHVLNPRSFDDLDMYRLKTKLERHYFQFNHRDVEGQLFVDNLNLRRTYSLARQCWLDPNLDGPQNHVIEYNYARRRFEPHSSDRCHPAYYFPDGPNSAFNVNRLVETPEGVLQDCKHFQDLKGRGWLHVAADAVAEPLYPARLQQLAYKFSRLKLVKTLLSIGVDPNHHDGSGETPLMIHIRSIPYQNAIIEELLRSGADPNLRNRKGEAALHIAVQLGNVVATRALLDRGANVHVRNLKCEGLLTVALSAQHRARDDVSLYAKVTTCIALAIDAGAIASPNLFHEWDIVPKQDHTNSEGTSSQKTNRNRRSRKSSTVKSSAEEIQRS